MANTGVIIPNNGDTDEILTVQVKNVVYDFRFRWNNYEGAWYLYIGLNGSTPKIKFKLVTGLDLLNPFRAYPEVPPGNMMLLDTDSVHGRPERDNFGPTKRFKLYYLTDDDLIFDPEA